VLPLSFRSSPSLFPLSFELKVEVVGKTLRPRKNIENNYLFTTMLSYWLTLVPMLLSNA